ncbi:type II/III secretion system protein [Marinobacter pelagius]|uniref:Type II/III secretion system protein n=1 Tax=Marinobacter pelagius TaxID=379482 RepID=A0A366GZH6_9GAMM|nr:secretin N-terminal domain-containing protein [Marinobacter pelagius]RBP33298.1 type II/III secretion system protein [Marinobacter pelagius]
MPSFHVSLSRLLVLLVMVVPIWLTSVSAHAQTETRSYQLDARSAEDVAAQIRDLYANAPVTVTARGQQLMVRGEPHLLDEIGTLVESLDVAPAQLRITVRIREEVGGERSGAGVSARDGNVAVTVERKTTSTGSNQQRTLLVQDGQTAHITSGQIRTLPIAIRGGRNPAAFLEQVETRSGFLVSAQVISSQAVELNIVSFEEDPAKIQGYETEALLTIRRVEPGQWVSLGSVVRSGTRSDSGIAYQVESNRSGSRSVEVKVEIVP